MTLSSGLSRHGAYIFYEKQGFYKKGYRFIRNIWVVIMIIKMYKILLNKQWHTLR